MSFNQVAATGVSTIGTLATVGIVAGVANNLVNNVNRTSRPKRYSARRVMSHRSIYSKTPRVKGYHLF